MISDGFKIKGRDFEIYRRRDVETQCIASLQLNIYLLNLNGDAGKSALFLRLAPSGLFAQA